MDTLKSCWKCSGTGILLKWICGYTQSSITPYSLCPVHGGCLQNTIGEFMQMIHCECSLGANANLEKYTCSKCGKSACSDHFKLDGVTGKMCFACNHFDSPATTMKNPFYTKIRDW